MTSLTSALLPVPGGPLTYVQPPVLDSMEELMKADSSDRSSSRPTRRPGSELRVNNNRAQLYIVATELIDDGVRGVWGVWGVEDLPASITRCRGVTGTFFDNASRCRGVCGVKVCIGLRFSSFSIFVVL